MENMKFSFDKDKIKKIIGQRVEKMELQIECPACGSKISLTASEVAAQATVTCHGCKKAITIEDKDGKMAKIISGSI